MTSLTDLYKTGKFAPKPFTSGVSTSGQSIASPGFLDTTRQLPNEGGSYTSPIFSPTKTTEVASGPTVNPSYLNPNGGLYSPDEVANKLASTAGTQKSTQQYDIPKIAGAQFAEKPQTTEDVTAEAIKINNARNAVATGETDPYKALSQPGIVYSPEERVAIQKAGAGIYDPALDSALAKLDVKQKREAAIFNTNENIRQWRETTGTRGGTNGQFTSTQFNKGASNAGMNKDTFDTLDSDVQNYFVNSPTEKDPDTGKTHLKRDTYSNLLKGVSLGEVTPDDAAQEITDSDLPEAVKHYYIELIPMAPEAKQGYFSKVWGALMGK